MSGCLQFDLDLHSPKPVIIPAGNPDLLYLIDTGADTPVWCRGREELLDIFPDAAPLEYQYLLGGFGTGVEIVDAFRISKFCFSDGNETLTYRDFIVAVTDRPSIGVDLILPATIFNRMIVTIDRLSSVTRPTLKIEFEKNDVPIYFKRITVSEEQKKLLGIKGDDILSGVYYEK